MRKKSIEHWEAMKQRFAQHPEEAVEYVRELVRQANELEGRVHELEAENADLRLKVEELGALCNRKVRQCCHKDKIISSLDLELAALKRELAGEMEKY